MWITVGDLFDGALNRHDDLAVGGNVGLVKL